MKRPAWLTTPRWLRRLGASLLVGGQAVSAIAKGRIGFNDLKIIEVAHLLDGIAGKHALHPTIPEALAIEKVLHGIVTSAKSKTWVDL